MFAMNYIHMYGKYLVFMVVIVYLLFVISPETQFKTLYVSNLLMLCDC